MPKFLNKIQLRGIVGGVLKDEYFYRVSLAVQTWKEAQDGTIIHMDWFNVLIKTDLLENPPKIEDFMYVEGRIKTNRYEGDSGVITCYEVVAQKVEILQKH